VGAQTKFAVILDVLRKKLLKNAKIIMFLKTKKKIRKFCEPKCSSHWFLATEAISQVLSNIYPTGCYSIALIDTDNIQ